MNIAINFCLVLTACLLFPFVPQYELPEWEETSSLLNRNSRFAECCNSNNISSGSISEIHCTSNFKGDVNTYSLMNGSYEMGKSIWMSRRSGRVKAKYFAHKYGGSDVHNRYTNWRVGQSRNIILKSSGAYSINFGNKYSPVGLTVDNGVLVNRKYDNGMDGLVIVYATGGIAISNIDDGDLFLESKNREISIANAIDRSQFLNWAVQEEATVFQTHLTAYKNENLVGKYNSDTRTARRKFLVLAKSGNGELFHIIFYLKNGTYTLYDATDLVLGYLKSSKGMNVVAMINLDTGGYDILNTANDVVDCHNDNVWGTSTNYEDMTNLLSYQYE